MNGSKCQPAGTSVLVSPATTGPNDESLRQIVFALERARDRLQHQADQLHALHDYSAELPFEDAQRMREAIAIISAIDGAGAVKARQLAQYEAASCVLIGDGSGTALPALPESAYPRGAQELPMTGPEPTAEEAEFNDCGCAPGTCERGPAGCPYPFGLASSMVSGIPTWQGEFDAAVALLSECIGPLEVSAAVIESEDGGIAIETLIAQVRKFVADARRALVAPVDSQRNEGA